MTMVIGAAWRHFALMVSDRLVTLARPGSPEHDPLANKTVIFISEDAVLIFGYTGVAYLGGIPTDQWIAQVLWGSPIRPLSNGVLQMIGARRRGPRGLNRVIQTLRRQLRATHHGSRVRLAAAGFRFRRGRFIPVLFSFDGGDSRAAAAELTLRPPRAPDVREAVIGVKPSPSIVEAVHADFPMPGPMSSEAAAWFSADACEEIIRRTSATDPTVGPHVMKVIIPTSSRPGHGTAPWQRRIVCRFSPQPGASGQQLVAFGPWVVSDFGFQPASVIVGVGVTRNFRGWQVELSPAPGGQAEPGFGILTSQRRKRMPR